MEKLLLKGKRKLAVLGVGLLTLAGCGDEANYSGEGNEFVITARVTDGREDSLKVIPGRIIEASGEAVGWFHADKEHQIHDNCDCHGTWNGRKTYGKVFDTNGTEMKPDDVVDNTCLLIEGKIRDNPEDKTTELRPVFDKAQIIECGEV